MKKSRILTSIHEAARYVHEAGALDALTMWRFDTLCLRPAPVLKPRDIRRIRRNLDRRRAWSVVPNGPTS